MHNASSLATTVRTSNETGDLLVRYWDVYRQQWAECPAAAVSAAIMATLPDSERALVRAARGGFAPAEHCAACDRTYPTAEPDEDDVCPDCGGPTTSIRLPTGRK